MDSAIFEFTVLPANFITLHEGLYGHVLPYNVAHVQ